MSIYNVARATWIRLTSDPARDASPIWAPDGRRVIFTTTRAGYPELFWRMADGTGTDERLFGPATDLVDLRANGWSADRKQLLFTEVPASIRNAIGQVSLARPSEASMLIRNAFSNDYATVSPGGGWMAYQSTSSGRFEIYVEQYPQLGNRQQISTEGGRLPLWSRDERELFFSSPDGRRMFAVPVKAGVTFVPGRARLLFEYPMLLQFIGNRPYDIAPDGRFAIIRSAEMETGAGSAQRLELVQNWQEELKRLD